MNYTANRSDNIKNDRPRQTIEGHARKNSSCFRYFETRDNHIFQNVMSKPIPEHQSQKNGQGIKQSKRWQRTTRKIPIVPYATNQAG